MPVKCAIRELDGQYPLLALARKYPERYSCLLESRSGIGHRYDLLFRTTESVVSRSGEPFLPQFDNAWSNERTGSSHDFSCGLPFQGGWVLFLSYELVSEYEQKLALPPFAHALPVALALRAPAAVVYDRLLDKTFIVAEPSAQALLPEILRDLDKAEGEHVAASVGLTLEEEDPAVFLAGIAKIKDYLQAGDVFQVNLSRFWKGAATPRHRAVDLYAALRAANPAPFAGFLQYGDWAVISSSPERLVQVRNGMAQTRPIAGTWPRGAAIDDESAKRALLADPKERAEHVMLVDLERNDLGRICAPGTLHVDELMTVETYRFVHHLVSNVSGRLRPGISPGQVIRAVFPGGTITGCPKVRCMQIIAELERAGRGPYTGALGYVNHNGDLDLNILIRTIWKTGAAIGLRAGSGIVVGSDPERELNETRAKAAGVLKAFAELA